MHPVLSRFLDIHAAREVLRKADAGESLDDEERLWLEAAAASSDFAVHLKGPANQPGPDTQQATLYLATHAAARALQRDPDFQPHADAARSALKQEGASDEQVQQLFATVVLEEAFGYEEDARDFDRPYVGETLATLGPLARIDADKVDALRHAARKAAPEQVAKVYASTLEALLEAAWEDGPQPITPEHVQAALGDLVRVLKPREQQEVYRAMLEVLELLRKEGLVGPLRAQRLRSAAQEAAEELELGLPPTRH